VKLQKQQHNPVDNNAGLSTQPFCSVTIQGLGKTQPRVETPGPTRTEGDAHTTRPRAG